MYSVTIDGENYLTANISAELLVMLCGGAVSIVPCSAVVPLAGTAFLDLGHGRGLVVVPVPATPLTN